MENKIFKQEVEIIITPQAQKVIASSKYSIEQFKEWALQERRISFGGHNATEFLEAMYNKNEVKHDG
jgi:hypothetical protein